MANGDLTIGGGSSTIPINATTVGMLFSLIKLVEDIIAAIKADAPEDLQAEIEALEAARLRPADDIIDEVDGIYGGGGNG